MNKELLGLFMYLQKSYLYTNNNNRTIMLDLLYCATPFFKISDVHFSPNGSPYENWNDPPIVSGPCPSYILLLN